MGCGCDEGYREEYDAIIAGVMNRDEIFNVANAALEKCKTPEEQRYFQGVKDSVKDMDGFSVKLKCPDGGDLFVGANIFPQSEAWARDRIGKVVHVVMTQLPNKRGGGHSMDVRDVVEL